MVATTSRITSDTAPSALVEPSTEAPSARPADQAKAVLRGWRDALKALPKRVTPSKMPRSGSEAEWTAQAQIQGWTEWSERLKAAQARMGAIATDHPRVNIQIGETNRSLAWIADAMIGKQGEVLTGTIAD